jgi:hypothetical protein
MERAASEAAAKFTLELAGISLEWMRLLILELSLAGRQSL